MGRKGESALHKLEVLCRFLFFFFSVVMLCCEVSLFVCFFVEVHVKMVMFCCFRCIITRFFKYHCSAVYPGLSIPSLSVRSL